MIPSDIAPPQRQNIVHAPKVESLALKEGDTGGEGLIREANATLAGSASSFDIDGDVSQ